jgi:ribonuclease HI
MSQSARFSGDVLGSEPRMHLDQVAVFSDSQAAIRRTEHLEPGPGEPGPGQPLARWVNRNARALRKVGIETEIHWVPGHTGIPGNEEADCPRALEYSGSGNH